MPTVLRQDGFRLYFYSHEPNEPPHVHVDKAGATAKVWLETTSLALTRGFDAREIGTILRLVRENRIRLLEAWHDYFDA